MTDIEAIDMAIEALRERNAGGNLARKMAQIVPAYNLPPDVRRAILKHRQAHNAITILIKIRTERIKQNVYNGAIETSED